MPELKGSTPEIISENISRLSKSKTKAGKKRTKAQNIAIALRLAGKSKANKPKKRITRKKSLKK